MMRHGRKHRGIVFRWKRIRRAMGKIWELLVGNKMKRLIHFLVLKGLILTLYTISCAQNPELVVQTGHTDWVFSVVFSADGKTVASGADDNTIKLWDVKTGQEMKTLSGHTDRIISLAFSSDSKTLASGSLDGTIKLWDVISGRESKTIIGLG